MRLVLLAAVFLIGPAVSGARACMCGGGSTAKYFADADEVFTGRVVSVTPPPPIPEGHVVFGYPDTRVVFQTDRWWKGHRLATITAYYGECGGFDVGETYLVFAWLDDRPALVTGDCMGTWNVRSSAEALAALGPSLPALPGSTPPPYFDNALPRRTPMFSVPAENVHPEGWQPERPPRPFTSHRSVWVAAALVALTLGTGLGFAAGRRTRRTPDP